jgi:hypothetical protein
VCKATSSEAEEDTVLATTSIQNLQNRKAFLQNYGVCEKKVYVVRDVVTEGETERVSATAGSCYGERNLTACGNT